jgi:Septum formation
VSCTGPHTAATIFVGRLDTVVDGHAVAVDSSAVQRQLSTTCPRKLARYVGGSGGTRALSRFNVVWYSPTLDQSDRGADWFRCDLILFGMADTLQALPPTSRLRRVLDRPGALATYGLCGTAAPGARGFSRVVCARPHSWRAVDTIGIGDGPRYPGVAAARRAGNAQCRDLARSRSGGSLTFRYGWEWPTAEQWGRGQHFGYCWVPD